VAERARRFGPLPYDEVLELALYDEKRGFYARGSGAGRGGDFLTSPEVGPLFGRVLAAALDSWWDGMGQPDPYVVMEAGAGSGALAASVLDASPRCSPALRYVLVERSARWREVQARRLALELPSLVLGPVVARDPDEGPVPVPGIGPLVTALAELPVGPYEGLVVANELLDNLAFRLLERRACEWCEVRVTAELSELVVDAPPDLAALARLVPEDAPDGARIPVQRHAGAWLRDARSCLSQGRVVVIDYADTTASMARRPWTEWVRTYRGHARGGGPLDHLGEQDVTCEVAVDQLDPPSADRAQAEFLRAHGIDALAAAARQRWQERAHIGDLQALKDRSVATEAAALTDPAGLGGFRVLEWAVG